MFDFLKQKKPANETTQTNEPTEKKSFFSRLKAGLTKTRVSFTSGISNLFLGKKALNDELLDLIEMQLLSSDVGVEVTQQLTCNLIQKLGRKELTDSQTVLRTLQQEMLTILQPCQAPLRITDTHKPFIILVVGINGSGKTTTIGKLAKQLQLDGQSVMLAAGDTFRAAATEQLQIWGERNKIPVIAQQPGADTAAVIYDATAAAQARSIQVLIADTAGRLHTQTNLMEELKKITRVIGKLDSTAPHEILLILDASIGQNALIQAKQFKDAIGVTGIVLTKLDGTAKGGIIFAIADQLKIPIRFIGVGEGIDDLQPFNAAEFVAAFFETTEEI